MKLAMNTPSRFDEKPSEFPTKIYENDTKKKILNYLKKWEPCSACGHVEDCKTGEILDTLEDLGYTDGEYSWSTQGIYHFEKYNLRLNEDFIQYVSKILGPK